MVEILMTRLAETLSPTKTLNEAFALANRYQQGGGLRRYVEERTRLVIPACLVIVLLGLGCTAGTFMFLADSRLTLLGLILTPFVLLGSFAVQAYMFFSWLESRALALALGRRASPVRWAPVARLAKRLRVQLRVHWGEFPPVPWGLAAIFLFAPLAMLATAAPAAAVLLIVLAILTPIVYALFDR
jgi:hypothetical protein